MIVTDKKAHRISVNVYGEFTLADYQEFESVINTALQANSKIDLCFDLREMAEATIDVAWEDIVFTRAHANDFRKIAVLTDNQWVIWSAWLTRIFIEAEIQIFEDEGDAISWLENED